MDGAITVYYGTKKTVEEEDIQGGVVARARFRIPVQNLAGARGSGLVEEISWLPDHPGGPQVFVLDPGISAPEFQPRNFTPGRARVLSLSSLNTTRGDS